MSLATGSRRTFGEGEAKSLRTWNALAASQALGKALPRTRTGITPPQVGRKRGAQWGRVKRRLRWAARSITNESQRRRAAVTLMLAGADIVGAAPAWLVDRLFGPFLTGGVLIGIPVLIGSFWIAGLYSGCGPSPHERLRSRVIGIVVFTAVCLILSGGALRADAWYWWAQVGLLLLFGFYAEMIARHVLIRLNLWGAATAFVGNEVSIEQLHRFLSAHPELGLRPVGRLTMGPMASSGGHPDLPILGSVDGVARWGAEIEFVVVAARTDLAHVSAATQRAANAPRVVLLQEIDPVPSLWPRIRMLGPNLIGFELGSSLHASLGLLIKRTIDLIVVVPMAVALVPLIGILALGVKLADPGPAFYSQVRVGRDGRLFRVLKIRTMYCDADSRLERHLREHPAARAEWMRFCKLSNDPRILPNVGHLIRRMSLDELPQFWNVIRGDMTLVGPRPFPAYHTERFDPEFQELRASVPPGLTGLWQVSSRSNGDLGVQKSEDLFYIRNWSLWLDLYILLQTIPAVVGAQGAR
jgi:Undecaprenyl-phosphate galactose phosphotransferase WbaP